MKDPGCIDPTIVPDFVCEPDPFAPPPPPPLSIENNISSPTKEMEDASVRQSPQHTDKEQRSSVKFDIEDNDCENKEALAKEFVSDAKQLVDSVIFSSMKHLKDEKYLREQTINSMVEDLSREFLPSPVKKLLHTDAHIPNIEWMTIEEFTIPRALHRLTTYIKMAWIVQDSWLYCISHDSSTSDEYFDKHVFKIVWSVPTRRTPIPRSTAHVYFTFKCSTIKPKNFPVEVYYQMETNSLIHRPGEIRFQEKWLKDIIVNKNAVMETICF